MPFDFLRLTALCTGSLELAWPDQIVALTGAFAFLNVDLIAISAPCVSFNLFSRTVFTLLGPVVVIGVYVLYLAATAFCIRLVGAESFTFHSAKTKVIKFLLKLIFLVMSRGIVCILRVAVQVYPACSAASMQQADTSHVARMPLIRVAVRVQGGGWGLVHEIRYFRRHFDAMSHVLASLLTRSFSITDYRLECYDDR